MAFTEVENQYIEISLKGSEGEEVTVDEVGLFLYDFATLYKLVRLSTDPKYEDYKFSRFSIYRSGKTFKLKDKLSVERIKHESPIEVIMLLATTSVAVFTSVWLLTQIVDKIYNLRPNREKLEQDIEIGRLQKRKLEREELSESRIISSLGEANDIFRNRRSIDLIHTK